MRNESVFTPSSCGFVAEGGFCRQSLANTAIGSCRSLVPASGIPFTRSWVRFSAVNSSPISLPSPPFHTLSGSFDRVSGQPRRNDSHVHTRAQNTRVTFRSFSSPTVPGCNLWRGQNFRPGAEIPPSRLSPVQLFTLLIKQPSSFEEPSSVSNALSSDSRTSDLVFVYSKIRRTSVPSTHCRCYRWSWRADIC